MKGRNRAFREVSRPVRGNPQSSGFLAFVALFSSLSSSVTWTDTGFEPSVFYTRGCFLAEDGTPPFTLHSFCSRLVPIPALSPPASTLLSKKAKSKAFLITTLWTYSVVPALLLFQPCTWLFTIPLGQCPSADLHHELDSVWMVTYFPSSGSQVVFLSLVLLTLARWSCRED